MKYFFSLTFLFISLTAFSIQVKWTKQVKYANGFKPSIIYLENSIVLEVHQTVEEESSDLIYILGTFDPSKKTVAWAKQLKYGHGQSPSLLYLGNNKFLELHQKPNAKNLDTPNLYYTLGTFNPSKKTVAWEEPKLYGTGSQPVAAFIGNNNIIELHSVRTNMDSEFSYSDNLRYRTGTIKSQNTVKWSGLNIYGNGYNPAVVYLENKILMSINSSGNNSQFYQIGILQPYGGTIDSVNTGTLDTKSSLFSSYDGGSALAYLGNNTVFAVCSSDSYSPNISGLGPGAPQDTASNFGLYSFGTIDRKTNKVKWSNPIYYNRGYGISISNMDKDWMLEVHVYRDLKTKGLFYQIASFNDSPTLKSAFSLKSVVKQPKPLTSEELIKKINKQLGLTNSKQEF